VAGVRAYLAYRKARHQWASEHGFVTPGPDWGEQVRAFNDYCRRIAAAAEGV
jgi:hypothetical protein